MTHKTRGRIPQESNIRKKRPCPRCAGTGKESKTGGKVGGYFGVPQMTILPKACVKCHGRRVL